MLDIDFGNTNQFESMKDNVIRPRNLIVHGEDITIDIHEAEKENGCRLNSQKRYLVKKHIYIITL
ncbi:hypothetical protein CJF25_05565 [Photobacterium phosphoreum]|nr:hypothetical protein [Photobacterium phosphoreum]